MMLLERNDSKFKIDYTSFPLINSVLNGSQEGKIFSENEIYFIFHKSGFSYLVENENVNYQDIFNFFVYSKELPPYFHIYDANPELILASSKNSDHVTGRVRKRIQLNISKDPLAIDNTLPPGFSVSKIDAIGFEKLSVFNLSLGYKFWKSERDFLENGFGFIINNENDLPVSICYSACLANNIAEIDVATLPEYQKKGLAKLVVSEFIRFCFNNGITANWDCFEDNLSSLNTARRLGFRDIFTYNFLSIFNKKGNHETF